MEDQRHLPVLVDEVLGLLSPADGEIFVDGTVGAGGHAEAILRCSPGVRLLALDRDPAALELARPRLAAFGSRVSLHHVDYRDLFALLDELGIEQIDGLLVDLGVSSMQLDDASRGFSFRSEGPLDMRMESSGPTAGDIVNGYDENELVGIFRKWGEEPMARAIARRIVRQRQERPIRTTSELADLVSAVKAGRRTRRRSLHPATQVFQALRIETNRELEGLDRFLEDSIQRLRPGGRVAAISFHSLEDRVVKRTLRSLSDGCHCDPGLPVCVCGRRRVLEILTRRPVRPSSKEIAVNSRARSARLRAARRVTD